MQVSRSHPEIAEVLLSFGRSIPSAKLFPTVVPEAAAFVLGNPYAFALATCLDRQTRVEIIWTIPYDLRVQLGHLDAYKVRELSISELSWIFSTLPRKPRFANDAPRTIHELTAMVCDELGGDASRLWVGKTAAEVKRSFLRIHGVGNGIASMAVLLIEKAFGVQFPDMDRQGMDIKPDVNTRRVLYRLGVSSSETEREAVNGARMLNPEFPGAVDAPLWLVGREHCHPGIPDCRNCPLTDVCRKVGMDKPWTAPPIVQPAPNHLARGPLQPEAEPSQARTITRSTSPFTLTADLPMLSAGHLDRMRRDLISAMNQLDPSPGGKESLGIRLRRLTDDGLIPREISAMMRSVMEARNAAVYQGRLPGPAQSRALLATWQAIAEWAQANGVFLEQVD